MLHAENVLIIINSNELNEINTETNKATNE